MLQFLYRIYRILKVKLKKMRITSTDFARQKCRTRRDNSKPDNPVGRQDISLPKATPKTYPWSTVNFQRMGYSTYSPQEWNTQNVLDFTLMGQHS